MSIAVIYGAQSGIIRRFVQTDEPDNLADHVGEGEALLTVDDSVLQIQENGTAMPSLEVAAQAITAATGIVPELARCLVIDQSGDVVNVIMADPSIDSVEGHTLFQDLSGDVGSVPDENGNFS